VARSLELGRGAVQRNALNHLRPALRNAAIAAGAVPGSPAAAIAQQGGVAAPADWLAMGSILSDLHALATELRLEADAARAAGQRKGYMDAADRLLGVLDRRAKLGGLPEKKTDASQPAVSITFNLGPGKDEPRGELQASAPPTAVAQAMAAHRVSAPGAKEPSVRVGGITIDLG